MEGVHCVRDAGVAGSNPATPTIHSCHSFLRLFLIADGSRVNRRFPARKRIQSSVLAARLATEACQLHPRRGGCRECRVHAAPAVSCAICARKCAHEHTGTDGTLRHSLRNGFTAYAVLSPATNSSCHRRRRINGSSKPGRASQNLRQLDTSNGCQDHTVLPYAYRRSSARCRSLTSRLRLAPRSHRAPGAAASTASQPNVRDDHDTPLFSGRDGASL